MPTKKRFTDDSYRKEPWFRALCQALLASKTEEDMANMLRDVGTLSELQAWSERLEVAKHLVKGLSYRKVAALTGASTTTVTRVARFIENGTGGYRKVLHAHRHHRLMKTLDQQQAPPSVHDQPVTPLRPAPFCERCWATEGQASNQPFEAMNGQTSNISQNDLSLPPMEVEDKHRPVSILQKYLNRK